MKTKLSILSLVSSFIATVGFALEPIPDKLVVLTFDDSVKSHFARVRPILKKHGFGATFFITEGFEFKTNKDHYMTWEEISQLHSDGFEIGNHTRDHMSLTPTKPEKLKEQLAQLKEQLEAINLRCKEHGIPRTSSYAYPGNGIDPAALPILKELGIVFARRGGAPEYPYKNGEGFAYEPGLDHPLLIPTAGDARPFWKLSDFKRGADQVEFGRIAVLQFHGVPDLAHPWVHTPIARFEEYMDYLAENGFTVIAMRDLAKYVDPNVTPKIPNFVIEYRKAAIASGAIRNEFRTPNNDKDLQIWLQNMVWHHHFTVPEIRTATGMTADVIAAALKKFDIRPATKPARKNDAPLLVLPYPGGRHPRTGFRDGAIHPQRETKISVFTPWDDRSYVVVDIPEAIHRNDESKHGLLFLAHHHVDTMWTKRGIELEKLEWKPNDDGSLIMEREFPNGVVIGTKVIPETNSLRMEMWLKNGSDEMLSNLGVQNCVMLKAAPEFVYQNNESTREFRACIARKSKTKNRWIITAWTPGIRNWFNPPVPCMHSDPQFPNCKPGETKRLKGWLSFYEGDDIEAELKRIDGILQ